MEEFLETVLINTQKREVKLFSNFGDEKVVSCDSVEEFMNVLQFVRDRVDEDCIFYKNPVVAV